MMWFSVFTGKFQKTLFATCPNCQNGDADTIWSLVIDSQNKFGHCVTDLATGTPHVQRNLWMLKVLNTTVAGILETYFLRRTILDILRLIADENKSAIEFPQKRMKTPVSPMGESPIWRRIGRKAQDG